MSTPIEYFGKNTGSGPQRVTIQFSNGSTAYLKHTLVWHSPDGFQWGYGGSGPADLALNILYDYLRRTRPKYAKRTAISLHQRFKWEFIAKAKAELSITGEAIEQWVEEQLRTVTDCHRLSHTGGETCKS
jgi:hypothetical protein